MNVLFLTLNYPENGDRNIYTDLMQEFINRGDQVYVACQRERRTGKPTCYSLENGIQVLRIRTGNVTKTNLLEKGLTTLLIENRFRNSIRKYMGNVVFDLILYSTPPITFEKVVAYFKKRDNCMTYLLLKDIFPQNAVDIGMIREGGLLWRYFRNKEQRLYHISDRIGCMSKANITYLLKHNLTLPANKVEECPNSIIPASPNVEINRPGIRKQYGIPEEAVVFVYGGNLGKPQGISFLLEVLDHVLVRNGIYFLIIGSGTEYARIEQYLSDKRHPNIQLIKTLPKVDYDNLLQACDVGLIFLDARFTIPNFPSRITAYMEYELPIVAATDIHTDLKDMLLEAECGYWVESNDVNVYLQIIDEVGRNAVLRKTMGENGRKYLEKYYTVSRSYEIIMSHFKRKEVDGHVS